MIEDGKDRSDRPAFRFLAYGESPIYLSGESIRKLNSYYDLMNDIFDDGMDLSNCECHHWSREVILPCLSKSL